MENKYFKQSSNVFKLGGSPPAVTTTTVTSITSTSAIGGGDVTSSGDTAVTARGVVYGTSPNPTGGTRISHTGTTGSFVSLLTGLLPNVTYYVKAYATNTTATSYGSDATFKTLANTGSTTGFTSSEINSSNYNSFRRTGIGDGAAEAAFDATFAAIAHIVDIDVKYTPEEILKGNIK